MPGVEDVVLRFLPLAEPGDAVVLPDGVEAAAPAGDELVRIALVTGVENDLVARRVEGVVEGKRQLDDAEVAAEVPSDTRDDVDDGLADLLRDLG